MDQEKTPAVACPVERRVMPHDDMLPMMDPIGRKFALKFNPEHQQHGWIFYDNHGQWVTHRRALPHEMERAQQIIEINKAAADVPCRP